MVAWSRTMGMRAVRSSTCGGSAPGLPAGGVRGHDPAEGQAADLSAPLAN